jgi:hypothetical protein
MATMLLKDPTPAGMAVALSSREAWPALAFQDWRDTRYTLHLYLQIVGKVRLALAPVLNHWWHVPFYVSARGLTTSAIPWRNGILEMVFDFQRHVLRVENNLGEPSEIALGPRSVADFYLEVMWVLQNLGVKVPIWPRSVELPEAIDLDNDWKHHAYDPEAVERFWGQLVQMDRVFHRFRGKFLGKCSPVHFWWGSMDLACTRFSGRPAPLHPGGIPNLADWVTRESYSHECISAGWWPGSDEMPEAAFYAYAYPEPAGYADASIRPVAATYHAGMREWLLPYEAVRTAADPDRELLTFLQSTYVAAASLAGWDKVLERRP